MATFGIAKFKYINPGYSRHGFVTQSLRLWSGIIEHYNRKVSGYVRFTYYLHEPVN